MTDVSLPNQLQDDTTAFGSEVKENDDAIVTVVEGNLDNANIKANAGIVGSKFANDSIDGGAKLSQGSIHADRVALDTTPGEGGNRNELFTKADGTGIDTNILASRQQHGGKIISVYGNIAANDTVATLDDSHDWRNRMIGVMCIAKDGNPAKENIPGGASEVFEGEAIQDPVSTVNQNFNVGVHYTQLGGTGATTPYLRLPFGGSSVSVLRIFADSTTGELKAQTETLLGTSVDIMALVFCGPQLA